METAKRLNQDANDPQKQIPAVALEFQPDAIEIEERPVPPQAHYVLYGIIFFILSGILWASISEVDRIVIGHGKLVTSAQKNVIQSLSTATIKKIHVQEGQIVKAGTVLVTLDPTFAEADVNSLEKKNRSFEAHFERLTAERSKKAFTKNSDDEDRLQAGIFRQRQAQYRSSVEAYQQQLASLTASLKTNQQQKSDLGNSLKVLAEQEAMRAKLFKEGMYGSKNDLLEFQKRRTDLQTEINRLANREQEIQHDISKIRADLRTFQEDWDRKIEEELLSIKRELDQSTESIKKAQRLNALVELKAPHDAVVLELAQRTIGSVAKEGEPILTLVPLDVPIEVEVDISAEDIGYVRQKDTTKVKLDTFPFQKHGMLTGEVRLLSEDAFQKDQGMGQQKIVYRARIKLTKTQLEKVPSDFRLIPGMSAVAEIKVGTRTIISYFTYPIIRSLDESLREP